MAWPPHASAALPGVAATSPGGRSHVIPESWQSQSTGNLKGKPHGVFLGAFDLGIVGMGRKNPWERGELSRI